MKKKSFLWRWMSGICLITASSIAFWSITNFNNNTTLHTQKPPLISTRVQHADAVATATEGDGAYLYRPSSLVFKPQESRWTPKYPSQVTAADVVSMFDIKPQTSANGEATATDTGYQFETVDEDGVGTKIETSSLSSTLNFQLGQLSTNVASNLNIEFTNIDDVNGTLNFRVFQPISAYTVSGTTYSNAQLTNTTTANYRAVILPPTDRADETDPTLWKWDTAIRLRRVTFRFNWNTDANIISLIRQSNLRTNQIPLNFITSNFYAIVPDYTPPHQKLTFPQPRISLSHNLAAGILGVQVELDSHFSNNPKTFFRTFLGFNHANTSARNIRTGVTINALSNQQLLNSEIRLPLWDRPGSNGNTISFINKKVSDLLPTQFLSWKETTAESYKNYSLLDLVTGKKIAAAGGGGQGSNELAPLDVKVAGFENGIAYLTLAGDRSKTGSNAELPEFNITEVRGFADDRKGTVDLLIYFQTLNNAAAVVQATPLHLQYTGFNTNTNSGSSLFFTWNSSLPSDLATLTSNEILTSFRNQIGNNNYTGAFTNNAVAKSFVSRFFTSSRYFSDEYQKSYDPVAAQGATVAIEPVKVNAAATESDSIKISIKMASFNGTRDQVFTNTFIAHQNSINIDPKLVSTIEPRQEFLLRNHRFSQTFASRLTDDQILQIFNLTIPPGGNQYTSDLREAKVFSISNDQEGQLIVVLLLPRFNGIENYEFNFRVNNFRQNEALENGLSLTHVPVISLPSTFLARNPLDPNDLTTNDILTNLFSSLPTAIARLLNPNDLEIVERKPNSVVVDLKINWNELINRTNNSINNPSNADAAADEQPTSETANVDETPEQDTQTQLDLVRHENEVAANSNEANQTGRTQTLRFVINGFLGRNGFVTNNQSPVAQIAILDNVYIAIIGASMTALLFVGAVVSGSIYYRRKRIYGTALEADTEINPRRKRFFRRKSTKATEQKTKLVHHKIKNNDRPRPVKSSANYQSNDWGKI
ncbi:hypothetical protein J2Z62_000027 [Mycoplasmoides fastidiosum]|uniref:Uncharacterized protein n=1 Tax=Mycoplasmoides fastidiosum TaxID=92758 RepID=A0ABU0LXZ5_9BACT|nr:hypothetical protein [Mycoplasmoides fastidiosum]MDQ0513589.1 hypothetical protein [Mycoplasmoides fastidiosum]UUD37988.1 hypothetical protein NPA10_01160 [Mycoplasmoides fastidiosum]